MKHLLFVAIAIITFLSPRDTFATTLVNVNFDSGYTANQTLNGQSSTSDIGLSGTFSSSFPNAIKVIPATGADNLTYQVSGGGIISSGSNVIRFTAPDSGGDIVFSRSLSTPITGQTVYARVIFNPISPSGNTSGYVNFFINSNSLPNGIYDLFEGTGLGAFFGNTYGAGIGNNFYANHVATAGSMVTGQPTLLVARYNYTAGVGYTGVDFFLNPTATTTTPNSSATFSAGVPSLNTIGLVVANLSGTSLNYDFDSFVVGTQWSDVMPAPTTLVSLNFDSGYTANQTLNGQSSTSDIGLSGTFSSSLPSAINVVPATGADNLTYQVTGGGTISSGSNVLRFTAPDSNGGTVFSRSLSTPITGQTVYARVIINPIAPSTGSSAYVNFFINSNSLPNGNYDLIEGTGLGTFGTVPGAGIGNNFYSNQVATFGSMATGQPSLLVARYNYTAGVGYTSVDFFLNPTATTTTPNSSATFSAGVPSLNMIGLVVGNLSGTSPTYDFDSFAVGTQWSSVVPAAVPPATLVNLDFDSYTAGQSLNGQSGSSDVGLSGTFSSSFASSVTVVAASGANNLSYQVSGGGIISSGSNVLRFTAPDSNGGTIFTRSLSTPITGQTVYARVIINPISPSTNSSADVNFFINSNSLPNGNYDLIQGTGLGMFGGASGAGAGIGNNFYSNHLATFGSLATGQPSLLVARYNYTAGVGYTSVDFFLNPTATTTTPNSSATFPAGVPSLNMIGLAVGNLSGTAPTYDFDSFAVGTQWLNVVPAAAPVTIAPANIVNTNFPGTGFVNFCSEGFTAATPTMMNAATGLSVLNFGPAFFGSPTVALASNGTVFGNTTAIAPFATTSAITSFAAPGGHVVSAQWRSFDSAHYIMSAANSANGVFLVKDRPANDTTVSGQGLIAGPLTGSDFEGAPGIPGGAYFTFDQNLAQFGVELKCNAGATQDIVVLFDQNGTLIGKYSVAIPQGQSLFFGIVSPHSVIRSVLISQGGSVNGLVIDEMAFVPAPAPAFSLSYSFTSPTGWSQTSGTTLVQYSDHLTIQGTTGDSKIYRSITLAAGTYTFTGTGSENCDVNLVSADWSTTLYTLNLSQSSGWQTDHQNFVIAAGTYNLEVQVTAVPGNADIQSLSITSPIITPYTPNTSAMQTAKSNLGVLRGMMSTWDGPPIALQPLGLAYFQELKTWGCNIVRLQVHPVTYANSLGVNFWTAWPAYRAYIIQNVQEAKAAGLRTVIDLHEMPSANGQADSQSDTDAEWSKDDLGQTFGTVWRDIANDMVSNGLTGGSGVNSSVFYELENEPYDTNQLPNPARQWLPLAINVVHTIRTIDTNSWIVYDVGPGAYFSGFNNLTPLPDNQILYSGHFYNPQNYCLQNIPEDGYWQYYVYPAFVSYNPPLNPTLASYLSSADAFSAQWPQAPIYIGEFSVPRWAPGGANWLNDLVTLFEARNWSWSYVAWNDYNGWDLNLDNSYTPNNPPAYLPDSQRTDRGLVIYNFLQRNGP